MRKNQISTRLKSIGQTCLTACALLVISALLTGCKGASVAATTGQFPVETGFIQRHIVVDGVSKTVWVFVPLDYQATKMYPAILFLHGLFEQGSGNGDANVLSAGLGPIIARAPEKWPFITIFPQSTGTWIGADRDRLAIAALNDAEKHYMIDTERVILAGLSYGGLGVWEIGANHSDRFAALVPVSGMRAPELADQLKSIPVWAFASEGDPVVNPSNSMDMYQAIQSKGGSRVRVTEFKGAEHDCWTEAVDTSELVAWMLMQRRDPLQSTLAGYRAGGRLRSISN